MTTPRFYAPDARADRERVELPDEEAAHLSRVLRLKPGAAVSVFNGTGGEFSAVVDAIDKSRAVVRIIAPAPARAEAPVAVTLAQAVLKGDKMDDVVRDAVMMGVSVILPIVTARSEVSLSTLTRARRQERWQRVAISSAKQCGRAVVPPILAPVAFATPELLDCLPPLRLLLVEPGAVDAAGRLDRLPDAAPPSASLIVGPEGGWTPVEIEWGLTHAESLELAALTLRADAAALVALTAVLTRWRAL